MVMKLYTKETEKNKMLTKDISGGKLTDFFSSFYIYLYLVLSVYYHSRNLYSFQRNPIGWFSIIITKYFIILGCNLLSLYYLETFYNQTTLNDCINNFRQFFTSKRYS